MSLCLAAISIKVLTDLENGGRSVFYRHAGPKGPEEASIGKNARCAGDNPGHRGHRGNPAPASEQMRPRGGQAPALREGQQLAGDRPRATVPRALWHIRWNRQMRYNPRMV